MSSPDRPSSLGMINPADAEVIKAFNTQFSHVLAAGSFEGKPLDVFTKSLGLRPMTGPLLMARTLEHVCLLSLGLIAHSVKHTNFSIGVSHLG